MNKVVPFSRYVLKKMTQTDIEDASTFLITQWLYKYGHSTSAEAASQRAQALAQQVEKNPQNVHLAISRREIAGIALTSANCIDALFVGAHHRRNGVGIQLINQCLISLALRGFQFAQMGCEASNAEMNALLEKTGWRVIGSETLAASRSSEDARVFAYPLKRLPESSLYKT